MSLKRPKTLARAAKAGAALYSRERDLCKLLPRMLSSGGAARIVESLRTAEAACEADRKARAVTYSLTRHVGLLSALVAESRVRSA